MNQMLKTKDRDIIRRLAEKKAVLADSAVNNERREAWYRLDAGDSPRPMILAEVAGIRDRVRWLTDDDLECESDAARAIERGLRCEFYQYEVLQDDHVIEPFMNVNWHVKTTGYGVSSVQHTVSDDSVVLGARTWDPPLKDLQKDMDKLRHRDYSVDREATLTARDNLDRLLGDILAVRIRGSFWWTLGLTMTAIDLIGLQNLMLFMFDDPDGLHALMGFLRDDARDYAKWLEKEGLLSLNNENDYTGSGSMGYTRDLPQKGYVPANGAGTRDLWVLSESQETVGVGPAQFEEFVFSYQKSLTAMFGKCYYGCCEPVHNRWSVLRNIDNLARVSVSPWADEAYMAQACGDTIVYSRKPNPTLISTDCFDEDAIRRDLRKTLATAQSCRLEIIMKDVHTLRDCPERLPRWVALAREEAAKQTS